MNITNSLIFVKSGRWAYTKYLVFFLCSFEYLKWFLIFLSAFLKASDSQDKTPNFGDLPLSRAAVWNAGGRGKGSRLPPRCRLSVHPPCTPVYLAHNRRLSSKCPQPCLKAYVHFSSYNTWHLLLEKSRRVSLLKDKAQPSPELEGGTLAY